MNVLFLTLVSFDSLQERNIYSDLLREFVKNQHMIYAVSPVEKRHGKTTHVVREKNAIILRLQIGNTQKTNIIEKGISTVLIEPAYKKAIRQYFSDVKFDLILYSTPPITLVGAIEYVKKRDGAKTYLLLKDIFPQNAVDIGMMSTTGIKGLLYRHFRRQEKKLYLLSDRIGCMSPANVQYVIEHNPEIAFNVVEVCPNSIDIIDKSVDDKTRIRIRHKYNIPLNKRVFVYGGNLGKPQGIPFLIDCIEKCKDIYDVFFLIVGSGTDYQLIHDYVEREKPSNILLMSRLPKEDYDAMVGACDVGLIFLDHRFTIPNFPSRLLAYMQAKLPVLAVTDSNTDIGKIIVDGGFGWWCESNDSDRVRTNIDKLVFENLQEKGELGFRYLTENYSVINTYRKIVKEGW
ncbi:MAG: glycosyltransferase family 4 protein [Lachnospiraceae bacterium]|nr:glycosyltransferase family 4 protein [uncultured Acetatifactor sp.]MCI8288042.1 glycosyltransferase family 4 protein [Lachnospiraceae bacterium]